MFVLTIRDVEPEVRWAAWNAMLAEWCCSEEECHGPEHTMMCQHEADASSCGTRCLAARTVAMCAGGVLA